ncbi:MAG: MotA/TolQ/ExbB proton channel family protein [Bdellovibrionales bacterium]|nr:MotA/TolQ/ExbB proton channel family protein [Bdellovibrionales bacterium]
MKDRIFSVAHYADAGVLFLLIALSIASLIVIFERYVRLGRLAKSSKKQRDKLEEVLTRGNMSEIDTLQLVDGSLEARLVKRGMTHLKQNGRKGLEESFSTFVQFEQPKVERSLTFLATVGSNAPYIGLFGTVLGIMKSFNDLANATNAGQQTVMVGISAALIATAAGLMVAIPNILAYNYFQKQVKSIIAGLESFKDALIAYAKVKEL